MIQAHFSTNTSGIDDFSDEFIGSSSNLLL